MRTKHFLTALCLPLAFAACTNDDFVLESNGALESRGKIDVLLTADKAPFGIDTRMSIDGDNNFLWEKNVDMIGAALVDGKTAGTAGNEIYVNYPFAADADGQVSAFSGKSSMTEGLYFFYYAYRDVLNRKGLDMNAAEQVYKASDTKTAMQQAASYMRMASPLVNLGEGLGYEDAQEYKLNLKFANLYTMVQVNIKPTNIAAGVTPKVTKITVDGKNGSSAFNLDAAIDMEKVATAGIIGLDKDGQIKADEQTAALTKLEKLVAEGAIYLSKNANLVDGSTSNDAVKGAYTLKVEGDVTLENAKTTSLYILVPKGEYQELELKVETTEGVRTRTVKAESGNIELANKLQPITADLNFALDGTGNVILPKTFDIASEQDWKDAVEFMTNHAVGYLNNGASFNLTKDVAIDNLPIFKLKVTGAKELKLKKDYTINNENKDQFEFEYTKLAAGKDATLTISAQPKFATGIVNYGTLNISTDLTNAITNFGTMNVTNDAKLSGGLTNGQVKAAQKPEYVGSVNVAKGKTLEVNIVALTNTNGTVTVAEEATLHINNVASKNAAKGTVVVKGTLKETTTGLTNEGTIDNFGSLKVAVANDKGKIIVEKGSASDNTSEISKGVVEVMDIKTFAALQKDANAYKFSSADAPMVTAKVSNLSEYKAADGTDENPAASVGITDITLTSGEWTLADAAGATDGNKKVIPAPTNAAGLILNGATLILNQTSALAKRITATGSATSAIKAGNGTNINQNITVEAGATLNVENGVIVNATLGTETATIDGTLNVKAGAAMNFGTATVGKNGELYVEGSSDTVNKAGEFQATTFNNKGWVESLNSTKKTGGETEYGKVSQPTNEGGTGTFKGNPTTF